MNRPSNILLNGRQRGRLVVRWLAVVCLSTALVTPTTWGADTYALLVGVSGYPQLPERLRLAGPANDVQLMRASLVTAGLRPANITVLADGVAASRELPTRAAILSALARLATVAKRGDWAVIYVSGHGSQQPQILVNGKAKNGYIEPDGLDEIFLPLDVGRWDGKLGTVAGAIVDDEFGEAFAKITAKGAHVWAVFDTCHAGDMAKSLPFGEARPVARHVAPTELGVAASMLRTFGSPQPVAASRKTSTAQSQGTAPLKLAALGQGQLVSFYASHPDEPAAEERLPDVLTRQHGQKNTRELRYFGLFTYVLAQVLNESLTGNGKATPTLADLSATVAARYKTRPYPRPIFEGDLTLVPAFFHRAP